MAKDDDEGGGGHTRWARLRFAIVGSLLAAPPPRGELHKALEELAGRQWRHPITGEPASFEVPTIERWYYEARRSPDPVAALRRKVRDDAGTHPSVSEAVRRALCRQHAEHRSWSYKLHADNLVALAGQDTSLGALPSYPTIVRYMKAAGLAKRRRLGDPLLPGVQRAQQRLEEREVRGYEAEYVGGLWHWDGHHCSRTVLTPRGERVRPLAIGVLDDRSRLGCHLQWYLADESAEIVVHALRQALQKRGLPRAAMSDNGSGNIAAETVQGLLRLGIAHETTLPRSPYQNGKQESFWGTVEGRLMAMLESVPDLTLELLNRATLAWLEREYNRERHSETGQPPLERFLAGPSVLRDCPDGAALDLAFGMQQSRSQRTSDGTASIQAVRFEIPSRHRHLERVCVRYARWDLSRAWLMDERTDKVLCVLRPQDLAANADGRRRSLSGAPAEAPAPAGDIAPLLKKYMSEYAATGLAPAYIPKEED